MHICDIHSHILPGIDNGSPDWETTMAMLKDAWKAGVREIIATPNYLPWQKHPIAQKIQPFARRQSKGPCVISVLR